MLLDPLCDGLLASVNSPTASSKQKSIELHNPSVVTELKYTGSMFVFAKHIRRNLHLIRVAVLSQFKWNFDWEEYVLFMHRFSVHYSGSFVLAIHTNGNVTPAIYCASPTRQVSHLYVHHAAAAH